MMKWFRQLLGSSRASEAPQLNRWQLIQLAEEKIRLRRLAPHRDLIAKLIVAMKDEWKREAIRFVLDETHPLVSDFSSRFGSVCLALPDEGWPQFDDKPMLPICQINVAELPYQPETLEGVAFLTFFFFEGSWLPGSSENVKGGFVLRSYATLDGLVALSPPTPEEIEKVDGYPQLKPHPLRFEKFDDAPDWRSTMPDGSSFDEMVQKRLLEANPKLTDESAWESELPGWEISSEFAAVMDDVGRGDRTSLLDLISIEISYALGHQECSKIGGWPSEIQDDPVVSDPPANGRFVFQLGCEDKAHWGYGDGGAIVVSRGRGEYSDKWFGVTTCY